VVALEKTRTDTNLRAAVQQVIGEDLIAKLRPPAGYVSVQS